VAALPIPSSRHSTWASPPLLIASHSRQVRTSPPWPLSMLPGKTFSRHGSSRIAANASDLGLSHPGTIVGSYPTGSGPLRQRFHFLRVNLRHGSDDRAAAPGSAVEAHRAPCWFLAFSPQFSFDS